MFQKITIDFLRTHKKTKGDLPFIAIMRCIHEKIANRILTRANK